MPPKRKLEDTDAEPSARSRGWCLTVFKEATVANPSTFAPTGAAYAVWQREVAPDTGRRHLQAYCYWSNPKTFGGVKKAVGDATAHVEAQRGSCEQAAAYCKKAESRDPADGSGPFEVGQMPAQGKRTDLEAVREMLDEGVSLEALSKKVDFGAWCRNYRAFSAYRTLSQPKRSGLTQCVAYWGPPGSGKTRAAVEFASSADVYWLPRGSGSTLWWDGYEGQRTVIVDEFYGWMRRDLVCRLVDSAPIRVEVKGGTIEFVSRYLIFTSNSPPDLWWKNVGLGAMARRLGLDPAERQDIGTIVYVGNADYPREDDYRRFLLAAAPPGGDASAVEQTDASGSVRAVSYVPTSAAASGQDGIGGFR